MIATQKRRGFLPYGLLIIVPVLAVAAFYWKLQHNKFPYTGTWVENKRTKDVGLATTTVTFDSNGGCSWRLDTVLNGHWNVVNYSCSYKMQGNVARVTLRLSDAQYIGGKWRFAKTLREKEQAPLTTMIAPYSVTSLKKGKVLLAKGNDAQFIDQKTGERWASRKYEYKHYLQHVK